MIQIVGTYCNEQVKIGSHLKQIIDHDNRFQIVWFPVFHVAWTAFQHEIKVRKNDQSHRNRIAHKKPFLDSRIYRKSHRKYFKYLEYI